MNDPEGVTDNAPYATERELHSGTGHIIVRLAAGLDQDSDQLREVARAAGLDRLRMLLEKHEDLQVERLIRHADPPALRRRERSIGRHAFRPENSLTAYWRIDVRGRSDAEQLRRRLSELSGEVGTAYHEGSVSEAAPGPIGAAANPYFNDQGFLDAAPGGIGARQAWERMAEPGSPVHVIDLEAGWILAHEDLPGPKLLYGDDGVQKGYVTGDHGAAAMGVVGGLNNSLGVIGIAAGVCSLNAVSHYDAAKNDGLHVADAISAAIGHLEPGDILLLEVQRYSAGKAVPVEVESADFDAIRSAVAHGIVVIEAAGNGEQDLDKWTDPDGKAILSVTSDAYRDSGAIMVGSGKSSVYQEPGGSTGHKRYYTSNYGSRVDVYSWGEGIYTAGYGSAAGVAGATDSYASGFGQTSGASAIIAGAAALVQAWHRSRCGSPLTAAEMRKLLSDPATGTPQVLLDKDPVGVMPNLDAIIT